MDRVTPERVLQRLNLAQQAHRIASLDDGGEFLTHGDVERASDG